MNILYIDIRLCFDKASVSNSVCKTHLMEGAYTNTTYLVTEFISAMLYL